MFSADRKTDRNQCSKSSEVIVSVKKGAWHPPVMRHLKLELGTNSPAKSGQSADGQLSGSAPV